jgi:hypothetical protein
MVMHTIPKPEDWVARWDPEPPLEWVEALSRVITSALALPIELGETETIAAYNTWLERNYLEPMRAVWPERYQAVVEQLRALILAGEDDDEKAKKGPPALKAAAKPKKTAAKKHKARPKGKVRR